MWKITERAGNHHSTQDFHPVSDLTWSCSSATRLMGANKLPAQQLSASKTNPKTTIRIAKGITRKLHSESRNTKKKWGAGFPTWSKVCTLAKIMRPNCCCFYKKMSQAKRNTKNYSKTKRPKIDFTFSGGEVFLHLQETDPRCGWIQISFQMGIWLPPWPKIRAEQWCLTIQLPDIKVGVALRGVNDWIVIFVYPLSTPQTSKFFGKIIHWVFLWKSLAGEKQYTPRKRTWNSKIHNLGQWFFPFSPGPFSLGCFQTYWYPKMDGL